MNEIPAQFRDRHHAGQVLAGKLEHYRGRPNLLVLGLPRGGVPVAFEVAQALDALLDVFVVRKLGYPGHEEYAMGAIASGGVRVMNPLPGMRVSPAAVAAVVAREEAELVRRELAYRSKTAVSIAGRTVIVVDDGLATGLSMLAALTAIRQQHPAHLCAALPVCAAQTCAKLADKADEVICPLMPQPFHAVGLWYEDFPQTSDEEVHALLEASSRQHARMHHH